MSDRACSLLNSAGIAARVTAQCLSAACPGAGIFLTACYENVRVGFNALGQRGKPAEKVAEEAVAALLAHHRSGAALDCHLADQLVLPAAVAAGVSRFTVEHVTGHLTTSAWLVERFGLAEVRIEPGPGETETVTIVASH